MSGKPRKNHQNQGNLRKYHLFQKTEKPPKVRIYPTSRPHNSFLTRNLFNKFPNMMIPYDHLMLCFTVLLL